MSEPTLQERLVYAGIQAINDCVTKLPIAEAHDAIGTLRAHLEARAEQTAASVINAEMYDDKPVWVDAPPVEQTKKGEWRDIEVDGLDRADDFADLMGCEP